MPIRTRQHCPGCGAEVVRAPGGRCPACGATVSGHVQTAREREERIEKIVAVVGTVLVVAVLAFGSGLGLLEGGLAYVVAGAVMFYLARKTF